MKEQEMLQDALIATKFLMYMYNQMGLECSTKPLRNMLNKHHGEVSKHNFEIFTIMKDKGFYPTMPAEEKEIKKAIDMHTQMQKELDKLK